MVELIGDTCYPRDFALPKKTTTEANAMSGTSLLSGTCIFNITLGKAEVWTGAFWESITSVAR